MSHLTITIVADSKPVGGLIQATYTRGKVSVKDSHLPLKCRTPAAVQHAICSNPFGGRMYHAGILYRWYGSERDRRMVSPIRVDRRYPLTHHITLEYNVPAIGNIFRPGSNPKPSKGKEHVR